MALGEFVTAAYMRPSQINYKVSTANLNRSRYAKSYSSRSGASEATSLIETWGPTAVPLWGSTSGAKALVGLLLELMVV